VSRFLLHDLRNPTQALTLVTALMDTGSIDRELLSTIQESASHLARSLELLDQVLRTSAPTPAPEPIMVRDSLEFVAGCVGTFKTPVQLELADALGAPLPAVLGSSDYLDHALFNLVLNSLEAIGDSDGVVALTTAVRGAHVEIGVMDSGPGVPAAVRDRLFQPFVTTKPQPAAGLGLAVAQELLRRMGGTVSYGPSAGRAEGFLMTLNVWGSGG
jgi:two-component system nitrogen regulation sensor histidine kinase GlnL